MKFLRQLTSFKQIFQLLSTSSCHGFQGSVEDFLWNLFSYIEKRMRSLLKALNSLLLVLHNKTHITSKTENQVQLMNLLWNLRTNSGKVSALNLLNLKPVVCYVIVFNNFFGYYCEKRNSLKCYLSKFIKKNTHQAIGGWSFFCFCLQIFDSVIIFISSLDPPPAVATVDFKKGTDGKSIVVSWLITKDPVPKTNRQRRNVNALKWEYALIRYLFCWLENHY